MVSSRVHSGRKALDPLDQGSPTPGPGTSIGLWPVRNWAARQEVSSGGVSRASAVFTAAPHHLHPPTKIHGKIGFHETGPRCQKGQGPLIPMTFIPQRNYSSPHVFQHETFPHPYISNFKIALTCFYFLRNKI